MISEEIGAKVEIGHFNIAFFNRISLENIYIEDQNADTLLFSEELSVRFKLRPLFKNTLQIDNILLSKPEIRLKTDSTDALNIQFIIDAITPDTVVENNMKYYIDNVEIEDGTLSFVSRKNLSNKNKKGTFDAENIMTKSLNCEASFSMMDKNSIKGSLSKLTFKEQSGFTLEELSLAFELTDSTATVSYLNVLTENSELFVDSMYLKYDSIGALKTNFQNTECNFQIKPSHIYPADFKYFHPIIGNYKDSLFLQGSIHGSINNIRTENVMFSYGKELSLSGNVEAIGLPDMKNTFFYGKINLRVSKNSLQDVIGNLSRKPTILPKEFNNLGICTYKGNVTGFMSDLVLYGSLRSNVGSIRTDIQMMVSDSFDQIKVKGKVSSKNIDVYKLSPESEVGRVSFELETDLLLGENLPFKSNSKLNIPSITFKDYTYKDISLEGLIKKNSFQGKLKIKDKNANVNFTGSVNFNNIQKQVSFVSEIKNLNLYKLNLMDKYEDMSIAGKIKIDLFGEKWENMNGECNIDSINIQRTDRNFLTKHIGIRIKNEMSNHININGDLLNGDIFGKYSFKTILPSLLSVLGENLPAINKKLKTKNTKQNQFSFYIDIAPTIELCNILDIPWYSKQKSIIQGQFNDEKKSFYTELYVPNISDGKTNINNISLYCDNDKDLNLKLKAETKLIQDSLYAEFSMSGNDGEILSSFKFDNKRDSNMLAGELIVKTILPHDLDSQFTAINILPSTLVIKDNKWDIAYSNILAKPKNIHVNNFSISGGDQGIFINGDITNSANDSLEVILTKINLDHISEFFPEEVALHFGGSVNGEVYISNTLTPHPIIEADVKATNFMFNKSYFGTAHATSNFDIDNTCLVFQGVVKDDYNTQTALLDGKYYFLKDSLDIVGNAKELDIKFLNYYLSDILDHVRGKATGDIHIHGITQTHNVAVDAKAFIDKAQASIDFLKTTYYFSDTIEINSKEILLTDIDVIDMEGNKGTLNGIINHSYFLDMSYNINIKTDNMLVLNTTPLNSDMFYGKAYATGGVNISGNEQDGTTIRCKVQTDPNTNVIIPIDSYYASDNSFITFVNSNTALEEEEEVEVEEEAVNTNLFLDMTLDVSPSAEIALLVNSKTGDMIRARGNGSIRVTYDMSSNDMKMYGNYSITEGKYIFTFQNALNKQFTINTGSSISWSGSPTDAKIDINAYYQLTASLTDILDENTLANSTRTTVPVQCILNLNGNMMQPDINFDIYLPNADDELRMAVNNAINTDELVNRQTVSLLVLGKFTTTEASPQDELYSVVSSTLSSVLNSWASQLFDNWNFGVNYRPGTGNDNVNADEYEFNFLYTPNSKITINGNMGYKDDADLKYKFIGDFDLEYKLIESGKLSAKIYTRTNDYNEFKQAYTTQGIGIVYRESFNTGKELWLGWINNTKARKEKRKIKKEERKALKATKQEQKKDKKKKKDSY